MANENSILHSEVRRKWLIQYVRRTSERITTRSRITVVSPRTSHHFGPASHHFGPDIFETFKVRLRLG